MTSLQDARTPRELARALIYGLVRPDRSTLNWLASSQECAAGPTYKVQIGGYLWDGGTRTEKLTNWQIGVSCVAGAECHVVFGLQEIYDEIRGEIASGGAQQLSLFVGEESP